MRTKELMKPAAAFQLVTDQRPHKATIWRWSTKGCDGVVLELVRVGKRVFCTPEMVNAFIDKLTEVRNAKNQPYELAVAPERTEAIAKAKLKLAKAVKGVQCGEEK
jgi:hypothetical protein